MIRSSSASSSSPPNTNGNANANGNTDDRQITTYIQDISRAVQDTVSRTHGAVRELPAPALRKHVTPVVQALEGCRVELVRVGGGGEEAQGEREDGWRERIPPLAFRTARAMKVCRFLSLVVIFFVFPFLVFGWVWRFGGVEMRDEG